MGWVFSIASLYIIGQRSEVGDQKSDDQKPEVRSHRTSMSRFPASRSVLICSQRGVSHSISARLVALPIRSQMITGPLVVRGTLRKIIVLSNNDSPCAHGLVPNLGVLRF